VFVRGRKAKVDEVRVVVGYCRVSTREQASDGGSLAAQENRLRGLAETDGRPIGRMLVDAGYSAGSLKRPAVQELLGLVREGKIAAIYCTKLDRLVRSLADLLAIVKLLQKHDVALVSASEHIDTGTAAGRMMVSMLGVIGEFERERLSERIKDVTFDKRQRKLVYCGSAPFGYKREGKSLVEDDGEQTALSTIRSMHNEGASYRQIARWLTDNGYQPKGSAWYAASVRAILASRMNAA
jgi:site-specific DNA recombinase